MAREHRIVTLLFLLAVGCSGRPGAGSGSGTGGGGSGGELIGDHGADNDRDFAVDDCQRKAPGCRTQADCATSGLCVSSAPQPPPYGDCKCPAGTVCVEHATGMGINVVCEPRCTDTGCGASMRCGASGRCEFVSCQSGFTCAIGSVCAPTTAGADRNGCLADSCQRDGDCPCPAYCVLGRCAPSPGNCIEPMP